MLRSRCRKHRSGLTDGPGTVPQSRARENPPYRALLPGAVPGVPGPAFWGSDR